MNDINDMKVIRNRIVYRPMQYEIMLLININIFTEEWGH